MKVGASVSVGVSVGVRVSTGVAAAVLVGLGVGTLVGVRVSVGVGTGVTEPMRSLISQICAVSAFAASTPAPVRRKPHTVGCPVVVQFNCKYHHALNLNSSPVLQTWSVKFAAMKGVVGFPYRLVSVPCGLQRW